MKHGALRCLLLLVLAGSPAADPPRLTPATPTLTVELGRQHYLAFQLDGPAARELSFDVSSSAPAVLGVEPALRVQAGRRLGFVELRPLRPGTAEVRAGGAVCRVKVDGRTPAPLVQILTPADGAALWGDVALQARAVGASPIQRIEWLLDGRPFGGGAGGRVDGRLSAEGPPGVHRLEARAVDAAGRTGVTLHRVIFLAPQQGDAKRSLAIEAEAMRPAVQAGGIAAVPTIVRPDPEASGKLVASSYSGNQLLQTTLDVPEDGWYQLVLRGRGDAWLAAPSVAVFVADRTIPPLAFGPITAMRRHERHAVGTPFLLNKGQQRITIYFYNDAYDPQTRLDRNLHSDRVELRHLGAVRPDCVPPRVVLVTDATGGETGGRCTVWASARDDHRVAKIELLIDGVLVAESAGQELVHEIAPDALRPGTHTLQAIAHDPAGNAARSRPQSIERLPYTGAAPRSHVLHAAQGRGPGKLRPTYDPRAPGGNVWGLYSSGVKIAFPLSIERAGDYALRLRARADLYQGPPIARVIATSGEREFDRAELAVDSPLFARSAPSTLRLPYGRCELVVEFINDKYDGTPQTDRNLHLAGLELVEQGTDRSAPWSEIVLPAGGESLRGSELVVARASDNDEIALVELLVDGQVTSRAGRDGRVALWLHGARLVPGPHTLQLRVTDRAGNTGLSGPRRITLGQADPAAPLSRTERGMHLLRRLGLGHNPLDLIELVLQGEAAWLERQLDPAAIDDDFAAYWEAELNRDNLFDHDRLRRAVVARALYTRGPLRERLAHFWDNHFSTWIGKTDPVREWTELFAFRALAAGRFRDLLAASATSAAMLPYLDNTENRAGRLNENYAREILELHTLGVGGGYTQRDVEQVSRIFTGWTATLGHPWFHFAFEPAHHDPGPKQALGAAFTGKPGQDAAHLVGLLAAHPSTARFVCKKLAAAFVADDPPPALVGRLARTFLATGGDIAAVLRTLVTDPAFFDRRHVASLTADPFELVIGTARGRHRGFDYERLVRAMDRMGRPLFGRTTPDGYPERGDQWLNAATLLVRWNFAEYAARAFELDSPTAPGATLDLLIDDLSLALLGRPLSARGRAVLHKAFAGRTELHRPERLRAVAALILQMPEAQRN